MGGVSFIFLNVYMLIYLTTLNMHNYMVHCTLLYTFGIIVFPCCLWTDLFWPVSWDPLQCCHRNSCHKRPASNGIFTSLSIN